MSTVEVNNLITNVLLQVSGLRLEYYLRGDVVSLQGDPSHGMYFIGEGSLQVSTVHMRHVHVIGSWPSSSISMHPYRSYMSAHERPDLSSWYMKEPSIQAFFQN